MSIRKRIRICTCAQRTCVRARLRHRLLRRVVCGLRDRGSDVPVAASADAAARARRRRGILECHEHGWNLLLGLSQQMLEIE